MNTASLSYASNGLGLDDVFGPASLESFSDCRLGMEQAPQAEAGEELRHASLETQNALYRSILSAYAKGLSDHGAMASFALEHPDQATKALEAYQAQQQNVIDTVQHFLHGSNHDTSTVEAELERLLRMRGAKSRSSCGIVDGRGSRRRR